MEDTVQGVHSKSVSPSYRRRDQHGRRKGSDKSSAVMTSVKEIRGDQSGGIKLAPNVRNKSVKKAPQVRLNTEKRKERQNALRNVNSLEELPRKPIVQDGSSGGREGRQFTVGKVGNNGMIYLRPVMRLPHQKQHQLPPFVFPPVTPPRSASVDETDEQSVLDAPRNSVVSKPRSPYTPTRRPRRSTHSAIYAESPPIPRAKHQRAHSFSTIHEQPTMQAPDMGTYRIVIDRPELRRPKTADQILLPTLEVQIPHYRLGSPRFSPRGSAFLHSSSFTKASTTGDFRLSYLSQLDADKLFPVPSISQSLLSGRLSHTSGQSQFVRTIQSNERLSALIPPRFNQRRAPIGPLIYDSLTFPPQSDDPSVVKYSKTGEILAATPPRIIAQITSPNFLDYELLSDFFLTYRLFLPPSQLVEYMIARLQWAVTRDDEIGKIVRVRTFVAIRHWILNYFVDDFVPDYELRVKFCDMVNLLYDEVKQRPSAGGSDARIIGEVRKCWQRTCALYWDGPSYAANDGSEEIIYPGGAIGSRDELMDLSDNVDRPRQGSGPRQTESFVGHGLSAGNTGTFARDVAKGRPEETEQIPREAQPGATRVESKTVARRQASETSVQIRSCTIPAKIRKQAEASGMKPLGAHPVTISHALSASSNAHAMLPAAITRRRPSHSHKRSGSFSDALRDERAPLPLPKAIFQSTQLLMAFPYAGSLVRGNVFPPTQAFVEVVAPGTPTNGEQRSPSQASNSSSRLNLKLQTKVTATSGPAVRRFLGSVRRALSTRQHDHAPGGVNYSGMNHSQTQSLERGRYPLSNGTGQAREKASTAQAQVTRIDLLGAGVVEAFKKAVQQETTHERRDGSVDGAAGSDHRRSYEQDRQYDQERLQRIAVPSTVTMGSKSIVIVDDTRPPMPRPMMSGALLDTAPVTAVAPQNENEVLEKTAPGSALPEQGKYRPFTPSNFHINGFPPGQRRSRSFSFERTPTTARRVDSFVRSPAGPSSGASAFGRPSVRFGGRSFKPSKSGSLRRYASYQSGISRRSASHSFDATTISGSITGSYSHPLEPLPARMLRRRPGGDLRAVHNVTDLEQVPRPRSFGSLSEYTGSVSSSILDISQTVQVSMDARDYSPQATPQRFSLGALAEGPSKDILSLVETHSSQPAMRPSFEAEVAKLAQIPDDDDDTGVESALMKLEGRYEKRQSEPSISMPSHDRSLSFGATTFSESHDHENESEEKRRHRHKKVLDNTISETPPPPEEDTSVAASDAGREAGLPIQGSSGAARATSQFIGSDDSYSSTPLLERGLNEVGSVSREWSDISMPRPLFSNHRSNFVQHHEPLSSHPSMEYVEKTESIKRIPKDSTVPNNAPSHDSFLFDDSDNISDLSSELSMELITQDDAPVQDFSKKFPPAGSRAMGSQSSLPSHPLRHPPSPPPSMAHALSTTPTPGNYAQSRMPPTPDPTPTTMMPSQGISHSQKPSGKSTFQTMQSRTSGTTAESIHLPFILAFESDLLARQFTLIEKDALNEVDWRELVELKWKQTSPVVNDWVEFLKTQEPKGVDLVIARFNLMVKWAMSEVVMTRNIEERVRTIVKFIHIAAHARKYQNYATMYQITVALLGNEISKLTRTWQLVPSADMETFRDMEALVQPVRNFHSLRVEMETAVGEGGCIPFIGIYTHDLIYNAQRPSEIASTPTTEPLVNFERHRTTAAIVKSLLRLLEASSKYTFEAVDGACERCLWIAALSDDEIRVLSRELE